MILEARGLTVRYPGANTAALDQVTLGVGAGELVALVGPNGCGKTTLMRALLGVVPVEAGETFIDGRFEPLLLPLALTISDDRMIADFTGASPQVPFPVNSTGAVAAADGRGPSCMSRQATPRSQPPSGRRPRHSSGSWPIAPRTSLNWRIRGSVSPRKWHPPSRSTLTRLRDPTPALPKEPPHDPSRRHDPW